MGEKQSTRTIYTDVAIFSLKSAMYLFVCVAFFLSMSIDSPQILHLSRTLGVTLVTYFGFGAVLVSIYGGYNVGGQKPRPVIVSILIAVWMTDIITYLQLQIMNVNDANNAYLELLGPAFGHLLIAMVVQAAIIVIFVHLGNRTFFKLNPPQRSLIISTNGWDESALCKKVNRYRLQYQVVEVVDYRDADLIEKIKSSDTVFFDEVPLAERMVLLEECYAKRKNMYYHMSVPDVIEHCATHVILDDVPLMRVTAQELSLDQRIIKRTLDIVVSLAGIVVLSPVMLLCALAIKLGDGGKVLYRQARATKEGRVFRICKFRTMVEQTQDMPEHSATSDDPRITRVGKVLRKTRIDELPQLFNILVGDMSLVGPRPEMLENVEQYTQDMPSFAYRLKVKAGLTGYAQIEGKYNTTPRDKMIMDIMYIEQYSLWLDIKLILRTITVFFKKDATEAFEAEDAPEADDAQPKK